MEWYNKFIYVYNQFVRAPLALAAMCYYSLYVSTYLELLDVAHTSIAA